MLRAAEEHYRREQVAAALGVAAARRVWAGLAFDSLSGSWASLVARMVAAVSAAQLIAARDADRYVSAALEEQNIPDAPSGLVVASAFVGVAGDGRPLEGMLEAAVVAVKVSVGRGLAEPLAMLSGRARLDMLVATAVQDAGRGAVGTGMAGQEHVTGYVRMLNPPSCSRCAVLAGRFYGWNRGFLRHPRCDCRHIPSNESVSGDLTTDPRAYFRSLSRSEQDRLFTHAGAEAIRVGADIGQVVNARRGMSTATAYGRPVLVTSEGTTRRGFAGRRTGPLADGKTPRLMPEAIFDLVGGDRDEAVRLLKRFGYLT